VLERPPPEAAVVLPAERPFKRSISRSGSRTDLAAAMRRSASSGALDRSYRSGGGGSPSVAVQDETLGDYAGEATGLDLNMAAVARATA
jgi:hypothetical protein